MWQRGQAGAGSGRGATSVFRARVAVKLRLPSLLSAWDHSGRSFSVMGLAFGPQPKPEFAKGPKCATEQSEDRLVLFSAARLVSLSMGKPMP